jgi:hypothetical protein
LNDEDVAFEAASFFVSGTLKRSIAGADEARDGQRDALANLLVLI